MSWEYFESNILMAPQDCSATLGRRGMKEIEIESLDPLPISFDWREKGVVSEVKDQGHCGSCWTFSSTGALEAHHAIKKGNWRTARLSEQQLIDCAQYFDNHGCDGGLPSHAFEYIHYAGGIAEEFFYPYVGKGESCKPINESNPFYHGGEMIGAKTLQSFNISEGDEEAVKYHLVNDGPVSVAFQVVEDFRLYSKGIYTSKNCKSGPKDVNHAVLVVGYGNENGVPFWTIKNSWGRRWGEEGYFRMERGKNMCGIATCASFPVLDEDESADSKMVQDTLIKMMVS